MLEDITVINESSTKTTHKRGKEMPIILCKGTHPTPFESLIPNHCNSFHRFETVPTLAFLLHFFKLPINNVIFGKHNCVGGEIFRKSFTKIKLIFAICNFHQDRDANIVLKRVTEIHVNYQGDIFEFLFLQ